MTLTLELSEELERQLREIALEKQISPEEMALMTLREAMEREATEEATREQKVKEAGDYVQRKNAELYRRLA